MNLTFERAVCTEKKTRPFLRIHHFPHIAPMTVTANATATQHLKPFLLARLKP